MSKPLEVQAQNVESAQEAVTRSIHAYQDTLVAWIDEEGREQIGTYTEFLLSRP